MPRKISSLAHENRKMDPHMNQIDRNLVWLRSLARANIQGRLRLRKTILMENSYLPGPLEGPYSPPKFLHTQWDHEEKTTWADRDPFPFKDAGIELTAHLAFLIKGWTKRSKKKKGYRRAETEGREEAERSEESEAASDC